MAPDDDKTRTHVDPLKGSELAYYRLPRVVLALLIVLFGTLYAQAGVPDPLLSPQRPPTERSIMRADDTSHFSYAISGLFTIKAEGIRHGFGIGFTGFFDRYRPVVLSAGLDLVISSLRVGGLPKADFVILSPTLDLTLRRSTGLMRPYAGVGINLHFSHLIFNEPSDVSISGYDSTTQARQIDMGWGIAPHVRVGLIIHVGKKQHVVIDGRVMSATHSADISYRDRHTGDEWKGTVDYSMPEFWISVGIIGAL